ncbi:GGDEF domain protein [hydrothermal vent metagenome]|uniref:GGDEF domain protein n=1 Tax=hydrothermal vent metagenome TaxID=652676 RepID=A0A3B0XGN7_9ZZZZ
MIHFPAFISSRSTLFGFAVVILLSASIIVALLVQVDLWNRAAFELVKKNTQQVQLVMTMRDAVQKREMTIQRMMNMDDAIERDEESVTFFHMAGVYANARDQLLQISEDAPLLDNLAKLDESVSYAQLFHNNLVEALVFGGIEESDLDAILREGRLASGKVALLLEKIIESQAVSYENVVFNYEQSRRYTLVVIAVIFIIIALVVVYAIRTSGKQFKHVSRLAIIDDVTGTYNRRYFDMVLEEEWKRSMREYTPLSLLMVDIDFFKAYNDSYGHQTGDVCLFSVSEILMSQLKRSSDFTARYGGEEFVIVLPNTQVEYARLLAERIRRSVEEARIKAGNDEVSPWVTVSIGLATTTAEYEQSSGVLIKAADKCLYDSKRAGRNRVTDIMVDALS